jgi:hypothetical protein
MMEGAMAQSEYEKAADMHVNAAQAHTAAAAAHHRGDHEAAEELGAKAHERSIEASDRSFQIARQFRVPTKP